MSDTRLSGKLTVLNDNVWFEANGVEASEKLSSLCAAESDCDIPWLETRHVGFIVENADGLCRARPRVELHWEGSNQPDRHTVVLEGEGDYEGLIVVLGVRKISERTDNLAYYGFILDAREFEPVPRVSSVR